jgi:alanine racemase
LSSKDTKVAILPIGYGAGFPRICNEGKVLICGEFAGIIGGVSMDATMVDICNIPQAKIGDEAVILGTQEAKEITIYDLSSWRKSVSYDQLTSWNSKIKRTIKKIRNEKNN